MPFVWMAIIIIVCCHCCCPTGSLHPVTRSTGFCGWSQGTYIVATVPNASSGSLPHDEQVHLCSPGTGTAQALSAAIGHLSYLGVPANSSKEWIQYNQTRWANWMDSSSGPCAHRYMVVIVVNAPRHKHPENPNMRNMNTSCLTDAPHCDFDCNSLSCSPCTDIKIEGPSKPSLSYAHAKMQMHVSTPTASSVMQC